ncbi:phosphotransferase family protein [Mycobacterium sp. SMC-4]|uniref:phosphotransferase family protein n=1 Tax=Mycobacterium sp. SMC-4 TaxID=2857059 RepID=UPI0021B1EDBF|nr:aminoglycoside phosphotransferase family protein [Mycobacterium sp. SMC-4]UXA17459.1 aminoglycoside phosphotransferase family protein [Mycobacterium sp. SMC-4]
MKTDAPTALAKAGISSTRIASIRAVPGRHRNDVWRIRLRAPTSHVVLKLQSPLTGFQSVAHEAKILDLLGRHTGVPALVAAGTVGLSGPPFLITEALGGTPLARWLSRNQHAAEGQLRSYAVWLHEFSRRTEPRRMLQKMAAEFTGPWAISYSPGAAPPVELDDGGVRPDASCATPSNVHRATLVHGSFDPNNILVADDGSASLDGVVDYEATRLGSPLIDIAGLALHLLMWGRSDLAHTWLNVTAVTWNWRSLAHDAIPYLCAQHERRRNAARGDSDVAVATQSLIDDFVIRVRRDHATR